MEFITYQKNNQKFLPTQTELVYNLHQHYRQKIKTKNQPLPAKKSVFHSYQAQNLPKKKTHY